MLGHSRCGDETLVCLLAECTLLYKYFKSVVCTEVMRANREDSRSLQKHIFPGEVTVIWNLFPRAEQNFNQKIMFTVAILLTSAVTYTCMCQWLVSERHTVEVDCIVVQHSAEEMRNALHVYA
jgi:hypothetical protein